MAAASRAHWLMAIAPARAPAAPSLSPAVPAACGIPAPRHRMDVRWHKQRTGVLRRFYVLALLRWTTAGVFTLLNSFFGVGRLTGGGSAAASAGQ